MIFKATGIEELFQEKEFDLRGTFEGLHHLEDD